jgi:hypothetical protein
VEWKKFQPVIFEALQQDPEEHEESILCLKELLLSKTYTSDTVIQIEKFSMLLGWFGDFFEEGRLPFLNRIVSLMKHVWFYGTNTLPLFRSLRCNFTIFCVFSPPFRHTLCPSRDFFLSVLSFLHFQHFSFVLSSQFVV